MAIYMAPATMIAEMMKMPSDQAEKGMAEWMNWSKSAGSAMVDLGAPLGKSKRVTAMGAADAHNDITGYTVVQADSLDAAAALFRNHPHLKMGNGASIEIVEFVKIPGM
jgi:hypothetical protein